MPKEWTAYALTTVVHSFVSSLNCHTPQLFAFLTDSEAAAAFNASTRQLHHRGGYDNEIEKVADEGGEAVSARRKNEKWRTRTREAVSASRRAASRHKALLTGWTSAGTWEAEPSPGSTVRTRKLNPSNPFKGSTEPACLAMA